MVQASQNGFTAEEVVSMTETCGRNRMQVYATFLSAHALRLSPVLGVR